MKREVPWYLRDAVKKRQNVSKDAKKKGRRAKRKGRKGEEEGVPIMEELTGERWLCAHGRQGVDMRPADGDSHWEDHHIEWKRRGRIAVMRWCEKGARDGASRGKSRRIVVWREDAPPGYSKPPYMVTLLLSDYVEDQQEVNAYRDRFGPLAMLQEGEHEEGQARDAEG